MKRIIKNKLYDTEKSVLVSEFWNGLSHSDFRNLSEDLYRSSKGNWFIHGSGGPMSKYATTCGNQTSGNEVIILLSDDEAYEFLVKHNDLSAINKYFSERVDEA
jgi:hypothetical protein